MADVVIFGVGDIGQLAHFYFSRDSEHRVVGFSVDRQYRTASDCLGLPIVDFEDLETRFPPGDVSLFIAVGYARMNRLRAEKYEAAKARGYRFVSYVSSRCTMLTDAPVGENCLVLEDNTIQPFVTIGNNVTLWSGNHIGHHSTIDDHCFISSHVVISGHVEVGAFCFIGVNATIRNGIRIAPRTLIAAGATVMQPTETGGVYVGERARKAKPNSDDVEL